MSTTVAEAQRNLTHQYRKHFDPEVFGLPESCDPVNNASRKLVAAMVAASPNGEVWLARINCYDKEQQYMRPYRGATRLHPDTVRARHAEYLANPETCQTYSHWVTTEVGIVYTFEFVFVLPQYDAEFHRLLQEYRFRSTHLTAMRFLDSIFDHAEKIGAQYLHWS